MDLQLFFNFYEYKVNFWHFLTFFNSHPMRTLAYLAIYIGFFCLEGKSPTNPVPSLFYNAQWGKRLDEVESETLRKGWENAIHYKHSHKLSTMVMDSLSKTLVYRNSNFTLRSVWLHCVLSFLSPLGGRHTALQNCVSKK